MLLRMNDNQIVITITNLASCFVREKLRLEK